MKRTVFALTAAAILAAAAPAHADTATTPVMVPSGVFWPYTHLVTATVTLDDPGTVTLVTTAYRHPATIQARVIADTGTIVISDWCKPTRLPTTWTVHVDGTRVGYSATLRCA